MTTQEEIKNTPNYIIKLYYKEHMRRYRQANKDKIKGYNKTYNDKRTLNKRIQNHKRTLKDKRTLNNSKISLKEDKKSFKLNPLDFQR